MTFPLTFTVGLHRYSPGPDDGYGNPSRVYTPPLDQPGTQYKVIGWNDLPRGGEESGNKDRVISSVQLFTPDTFPATAYDVIDLDGDPTNQWSIVGESNAYNNGPWWNPHTLVFQLSQVTG